MSKTTIRASSLDEARCRIRAAIRLAEAADCGALAVADVLLAIPLLLSVADGFLAEDGE